ncbi:MAG: RNA polymerase sigma factor [Candidatus Hydrogenedentes bacterium]|nr:RNA polymerase sigma factor [Candidatus Hydrogenedentota bacterium]
MDEALVRSAKNGDQQAFAKLVEEYYRPIYGLAFSTVGNWNAAEDVAQDAFLLAWANIGKLRSLEVFGAWLRRITRNLACNWIRSEVYRRALRERQEALARQSEPHANEALDSLTHDDARAETWAALESLSPALREAVVLFYLEENSIAQTAAMLGVSENSVKKRLHHARPKLRAYFEQKWKAELDRERQRINSREAGKRFLGGAALGPVSVLTGNLGSGAGLWLHSALHGEGTGHLASLVSLGSASAKPAAIAVALVAAVGAGLFWTANRQDAQLGIEQPSTEVTRTAEKATPSVAIDRSSARDENAPPQRSSAAESATAVWSAAATETAPRLITVTGHVVNEEERPIPGATVTVVASGLNKKAPEPGAGFGAFGGAGGAMTFGGGQSGGSGGFGEGTGGGGMTSGSFGGPLDAYKGGGRPFAPGNFHDDDLCKALLDDARRFNVQSAADGSFSVEDVPADGLLIVSAAAPAYCLQGTAVSPAPGMSTADVTLTLSPGIEVKGRAVNAQGEPISDGLVQITALTWSSEGSSGGWGKSAQQWGWSRTDAQGNFTLTVEWPGNATIIVKSLTQGTATFPQTRVEPEVLAVLRFPEQSILAGTITRRDGATTEGHTIVLTGYAAVSSVKSEPGRHTQASSGTIGPTYDATTDAEGAYQIAGVDPQVSYDASIFDPDGTPLATEIEIEPLTAGQTLVWNYTIPLPMAIKGVVTEPATGKPAAGTAILCRRADEVSEGGMPMGMPAARAVAGPDGAFEMRLTTGPGDYVFGIQTLVGFRTFAQQQVQEGETHTLNLTLPGSWTRNFLVLDEAGNPLSGVTVSLQSGESNMYHGYQEKTRDDGRIRVTDLPAEEPIVFQFEYKGAEVKCESIVGEAGAEGAEETIVLDMSK